MLTPKEKAEELYIEYWHLLNDSRIAKQCAFIAVNEILEATKEKVYNTQIPFYLNGVDQRKLTIIYDKYWLEVKQEIEKL